MKKWGLFLLLVAMAVSSAFAAGLGSYKVESITGKVQYEAAPGTWKSISVGQELSASTVVNTSLNSSLVINVNGKSVTIKAMQKGTVESLTAVATTGSVGIKKGASLSNSANDKLEASAKSVQTASSRASEAKEDIDWDE